MRSSLRLFGAGIVAALVLSACQQAVAPTTVQPTRSPVSTPRPTATPEPIPTPAPALALDKVGAAASPSGFLAFAVVSNPSAETALDVKIAITALGGSGQSLARRDASIARIAAGQRQAVAVAFPVGRTLPAQFSGSVANVRWSSEAPTDVAQVAGASFIQDARTPSVRVNVLNHGQAAARLVLIAVCWDAAGNIRGGGSRTAMVAPGARDVTVDVFIAAEPARCDGYAIAVG
jgi:hypothetical protein